MPPGTHGKKGGGTLHVKKDGQLFSESMIAHPVEAMKSFHVQWMQSDCDANLPLVEGSEQFAKAGNGKPLPGCSSSHVERTIDGIMRDFAECGNVNFQMLFGNEGWEPEVSFIKKKFKEHRKREGHDMIFAQQEGV